MSVPDSLDATIAEAKTATLTALEAGHQRVQIDLAIPEIALEAQRLAREFADLFDDQPGLKVLFPDTGAAALARRDWGDVPFTVNDLGSRNFPIEKKLAPEDTLLLLVCPSAVEVRRVEELCNLAGDRPVVLLIPQLEDVSVVGIGYAARQLRDRFLSTIETAYFLRPLDGAVVRRVFPGSWQVWTERDDGGYDLLCERAEKPMGEALDRILAGEGEDGETAVASKSGQSGGLLASLQRFLRALSN